MEGGTVPAHCSSSAVGDKGREGEGVNEKERGGGTTTSSSTGHSASSNQ